MFSLEQIKSDRGLFSTAVSQVTPEILGSVIDHTLLHPTASRADIEKLCDEAHSIGSFICVNGSRIADATRHIFEKHLSVRGIAAVIGFPFGAELTREKEAGALGALVDEKADEVDMVLNFGKLLDENPGTAGENIEYTVNDVGAVAMAVERAQRTTGKKKILKVIQENCYLTMWHKHAATMIIGMVAEEAGIHMFAKTSTGFGAPVEGMPKGATLDDVYHMNRDIQISKYRGVSVGVKAAGGVGDADTAVKMMLAGGCFDDNMKLVANPSDVFRIGASAGVKIVNDFKERFC